MEVLSLLVERLKSSLGLKSPSFVDLGLLKTMQLNQLASVYDHIKGRRCHLTDDSQQSLSCYRQTLLPRKLISLSKGTLEVNGQGSPDDEVPFTSKSVSSDKARWLSISGLALTNDDNDLLVCDSEAMHCQSCE